MNTIVFPAGAGVILNVITANKPFFSVPRRCGGDPSLSRVPCHPQWCSPQVRG